MNLFWDWLLSGYNSGLSILFLIFIFVFFVLIVEVASQVRVDFLIVFFLVIVAVCNSSVDRIFVFILLSLLKALRQCFSFLLLWDSFALDS